MTDRFNTMFGWVLFSGIVALGLFIVSGMYFQADKHHETETFGYPIDGGEEAGAGAEEGPSFMALLALADPAKGEKIFAKCKSCHTADQGGANGIGPNLYGVVGEAIGKGRGGFGFSAAVAGHGGEWTFENLDHWLTKPTTFIEGTTMSFTGVPKAEDRANLVAYLNTLGSNLPLPAVQEAAPVEEPAAEGEAAPAEEAPAEAAPAE